jgi:hypothetical protein
MSTADPIGWSERRGRDRGSWRACPRVRRRSGAKPFGFSGRFVNFPERVAAGRRWRLITVLRITAGLPGLLALGFLARPPAASAHLRSGTVAVDYRSSVLHADTSAYSARIFQSDRALGVTLKPGHSVVLVGYIGEPVMRLDAVGLWSNAASPTAVVLRLMKRSHRVLSSTPRWRLQRGRHSVIWQDARAQGLAPGVKQGVWSVPLIVDGRRARLEGELERFPAPPLWPWFGMLAGLLVAGLLLVLRRRDLAGSAAVVFSIAAAAASVVILVAFAFDVYASPGTWIEGFDATALLGVGAGVLLRGPRHHHVAAAIGLGLVGVAVGLFEGAIFLHAIVLAILPSTATRIVDVVAIGAGLDAAALGLVYLDTIDPGGQA